MEALTARSSSWWLENQRPGFSAWPAPAKINLFLHVTGREADGYHTLQTVFQLLDWGDTVHLRVREDDVIERIDTHDDIDPGVDLTIRAAVLLQNRARALGATQPLGVDLGLDKRIPIGGGLGGGSSDAATTLLALNALWDCRLSFDELAELGFSLGADVPVFVRGHSAFAEGCGEQLQPISLGASWFVVIQPPEMVPTAKIFASPQLTRDTARVKIENFVASYEEFWTWCDSETRNDLEPVARDLFPAVDRALDWLKRFGSARMSGSGACGFVRMANAASAQSLAAMKCPDGRLIAARGIEVSPLIRLLQKK